MGWTHSAQIVFISSPDRTEWHRRSFRPSAEAWEALKIFGAGKIVKLPVLYSFLYNGLTDKKGQTLLKYRREQMTPTTNNITVVVKCDPNCEHEITACDSISAAVLPSDIIHYFALDNCRFASSIKSFCHLQINNNTGFGWCFVTRGQSGEQPFCRLHSV